LHDKIISKEKEFISWEHYLQEDMNWFCSVGNRRRCQQRNNHWQRKRSNKRILWLYSNEHL